MSLYYRTILRTLNNVNSNFIIRVKTDNAGTSASNQFILPIALRSGYVYDYTVYWGDGLLDDYTNSGNKIHTYAEAGEYIITISGNFAGLFFNNGGDKLKMLQISNWGNHDLAVTERAYFGCTNLDITANDTPILTNTNVNFRGFLMNNTSLIGNSSINNWDVSLITVFGGSAGGGIRHGMFFGCTLFNQDISNWNVSNGITMSFMFQNSGFNQDISNWNVSNATTLSAFFRGTPYNHYTPWNLNLSGVVLSEIFQSSGMSTENYTDTIVYWANYAFENAGTPINVNMSSQTGRTFDTSRSGGANFADAGAARTYLISTLSWTISGDIVI